MLIRYSVVSATICASVVKCLPGFRREVEPGEFAQELDGFFVAGLGGFDLRVERAEVMGDAFVLDLREPLVAPAVDADVLRGLFARAGVLSVLLGRAVAQVKARVVQAVAIDVVRDHARRRVRLGRGGATCYNGRLIRVAFVGRDR